MADVPEVLGRLVPRIGSLWEWEPLAPHARVRCFVTAVEWNGEECWVEAEFGYGRKAWNELGRWMEAAVLISPEPCPPGYTRPGYLLKAMNPEGPIVDLHPELREPRHAT